MRKGNISFANSSFFYGCRQHTGSTDQSVNSCMWVSVLDMSRSGTYHVVIASTRHDPQLSMSSSVPTWHVPELSMSSSVPTWHGPELSMSSSVPTKHYELSQIHNYVKFVWSKFRRCDLQSRAKRHVGIEERIQRWFLTCTISHRWRSAGIWHQTRRCQRRDADHLASEGI